MEKIREYLRNPIITLVIGLVLGLIIGLPVLGWGPLAVEWKDAGPQHLAASYQQAYLCMSVDTYVRRHDVAVAQERFADLGEAGPTILAGLKGGTCSLNEGDIKEFKAALETTAPVAEVKPTTAAGEPTKASSVPVPGDTTTTPKTKNNMLLLLALLCVVLLVVGGAAAYFVFFRNKKFGNAPKQTTSQRTPVVDTNATIESTRPAAPVASHSTEASGLSKEPPIYTNATTYVIGDDLYDDSFSIDSPSGEFLGECGVGISETIGVGDPKKVTAFEVWLFDKNDIQTVTKVLMTPHAFADPGISHRLAAKGEPIQIDPGKSVVLETQTLQMECKVVDLNYGQGALPPESFIDRMTLELKIWQKPKAA